MITFIVSIPLALIAKEDLSAAIVAGAICLAMIFVAYKDMIKIVFLGIFGLVFSVVFLILNAYRITRIKTYLDGPWSDPEGAGRQTVQSLYAIGSGGLTGIGLGQSMQKMGYISEAHNDIIFAIICEELGLLGGISIIGLFMLLIYRIAQISFASKSLNHYLVGIGVMTHIAVQVFINIGVAINLIPTTGMPLPFISYGGSSLIMFMVEIGLVLNIARHNHLEEIVGGDLNA
jgi:cell division protein FtsW